MNFIRPCKLCEAWDELNLRIAKIAVVDAIEASNISITGLLEPSKVNLECSCVLDGVVGHQHACVFPERGQVKHNFLRNAANIDTGAPNDLVLNHDNFFAILSSASC